MSLELRQMALDTGKEQPLRLAGVSTMMGSLASNQISLSGPGIEPIHGMIERLPDGSLRLTDLGTLVGIKVNGLRIDVDRLLVAGDLIEMGSLRFRVAASDAPDPVLKATVKSDPADLAERGKAAEKNVVSLDRWRSRMLFAPRTPTSRGRMLEVVAYWGDTVLNVDHFHPDERGFASVTIGDSSQAHFISGGRESFKTRVLANVEADGAVLKLTKGMSARVRQDGKVRKVSGLHQVHLGPTDYAHIEHGAVRYFMHYANLPHVELPRNKMADTFFFGLSAVSALVYLVLVALAITIKPAPQRNETPTLVGRPWEEHYQPKDPVKKKLVEVTVEPTIKREPPKPKVIKAVKPTQRQKPTVKPPEVKPVPKTEIVQKALPDKPVVAAVPVAKPVTPSPVTPTATPTQPNVAAATSPSPAGPKSPSPSPKPNPSLKPLTGLAAGGPKAPSPLTGNSGGPGTKSPAGALMGATKFNQPGVSYGQQKTPAMVDLKKLGVGLGQVLTATGGVHADFHSDRGGLGRKMGSASKDYNLGGPGNGNSLGLAGAGDKLGGWGKGPNGVMGGGDGPGGPGGLASMLGGKNGKGGIGTGVGNGPHTQASVELPATDPVGSGSGLPPDAIMQVIRSHLNEIRHCYEQLLQRTPKAQGKMTVRFIIGGDGRVQTVSVLDNQIPDVVFRGCVTGKIQRWPFPKPRAGSPVTVTYPFVFNPL